MFALVPSECLEADTIIHVITWVPIGLSVGLLILGLIASAVMKLHAKLTGHATASDANTQSWWILGLQITAPWALLSLFCFYPAVSRHIFATWNCVPYALDDDGSNTYFLQYDPSIRCSLDGHTNPQYNYLVSWSIAYLILWPLCLPMFFFCILYWARRDIKMGVPTPRATGLRFLHREYHPDHYWWETVETFRRAMLMVRVQSHTNHIALESNAHLVFLAQP